MAKYQKGKIASGTVTGIESYGIFVRLDEFYSGLIHISEISNYFISNINELATIGETIKVRIIDVDENSYHLKLSVKGLNYRQKKKIRQQIVETNNGFQPLKDNLDTWIDQKMSEIKKDSVIER